MKVGKCRTCLFWSSSNHRYFALTVLIIRWILGSCSDALQLNEDTLVRNNTAEQATSNLLETILENYDKDFRPYFATGRAVGVTVDVYLASLDSVKENQLEYGITIYLRQRWHDPRFAINSPISLPPTTDLVDKIWLPDLVIGNMKRVTQHNLTIPNKWVKIEPNGDVLFNSRLSVQLSCAMDFHYFPFDYQRCEMELDSFQNTINEVQYFWSETEPVEFRKNLLRLPQYQVLGVDVYNNCTKKLKTGSYSCIVMDLLFHREIGHYILQSYIPSILLVMTSWVSFWLEIRGSPARVGIGVTTILSMITLYNGVRHDISHVSYVKALDVWFGVCIGFVTVALMEYALVHYLSFNKLGLPIPFLGFKPRDKKVQDDTCLALTITENPTSNGTIRKRIEHTKPKTNCSDDATKTKDDDDNDERSSGAYTNPVSCHDEENTKTQDAKMFGDRDSIGERYNDVKSPLPESCPFKLCVKGKCALKHGIYNGRVGQNIDALCRCLFPLSFILFNIGYWIYYIRHADIPEHVVKY